VDHAIAENFIYPEHRQLIICEEAPPALLEKMQAYQPPENLAAGWNARENFHTSD
jgi:predicted Rossmann-fold nucleotide-binding protein